MPVRVGLHIIPLLIAALEYLAITAALKIAQTMGDYNTTELFGGLVRVGDNFSYHSVATILTAVHIAGLLLALFYFYMVTLHDLGRENFNPPSDRVSIWKWDDE